MTLRIAVVGAGPAGFAVTSALLADSGLDVTVDLVDRATLPDALLRHGPAAGAQRLRAVASDVDSVLHDCRVTYFGNVEIGAGLPLDQLRRAADAVILTTGAPRDLPLEIAGHDSVGVGTVTHVEAWLTGNADVEAAELDLAIDTAVLVGISAETVRIAEFLCGRMRHVQLVDSRSRSDLDLAQKCPDNLVVRTGLTPVGVVGRNRARALRCLHSPDPYGRVLSEDLRAQLLLRPRAESFCWQGIDENRGHIAHHYSRVLAGSAPAVGLYVAGWAGRAPADKGSHGDDAAVVVAAIHADGATLPRPPGSLADALTGRGIEASRVDGWSAAVATDALLNRFAGEGMARLVDYQALVGQVDED
jgi:ferredoxin/flavodoxin---NADP+ reductase